VSELTLRQEKFVEAVTTPSSPTYCKPSAAYRATNPSITPESSWSGSSRMLGNAKVSEKIKGQLGLVQLGSKLKKCLRETEKLKDWSEVRATVMDYAKLTGQLIEKKEVKQVSDEEKDVMRRMVNEALSRSPN
jgi:hypothetical protein